MPNPSAYSLSDIKGETVEIVCPACARRGVLSKAGLLKRYGDIGLPDLRMLIAKAAGCPKALDPHGLEYCKVVYGPGTVVEERKP